MKGALNMQETKTEVTETEVTETEVKEVVGEQVNETTDPKLPTTEEELNKLLQSSSSKAKGEILKELGYNSVKDIKDAIAKGSSIDELTEQLTTLQTERETLVSEKETLLSERDNYKAEVIKRDNAKLVADNNIPAESADLFLKLVDSDETEGLSREEKAVKVKEQLMKITGGGKIGSNKTDDKKDLTEKEKLEKMRKW